MYAGKQSSDQSVRGTWQLAVCDRRSTDQGERTGNKLIEAVKETEPVQVSWVCWQELQCRATVAPSRVNDKALKRTQL